MLTVWIDELTPCLVDNRTGELVETEVVRIRRKSFLTKYNKRTGWFTNWAKELEQNEVYALVIKGTMDIRGLVSVRYEEEARMTYASWMCANPDSIPLKGREKRYNGIGGHLFAIVIDKAEKFGSNGEFFGFAANSDLYEHYAKQYGAIQLGMLHPYHIALYKDAAEKIKEEYTYEWTEEEL